MKQYIALLQFFWLTRGDFLSLVVNQKTYNRMKKVTLKPTLAFLLIFCLLIGKVSAQTEIRSKGTVITEDQKFWFSPTQFRDSLIYCVKNKISLVRKYYNNTEYTEEFPIKPVWYKDYKFVGKTNLSNSQVILTKEVIDVSDIIIITYLNTMITL